MLILRLLTITILPVLVVGRVWAVVRGREGWADFVARWRGPAMPDAAIWIHGASVGELAAAKPVIAALSDHKIVVTANTTTGRARVASWSLPNVTPALAPFDFRRTARRMMVNAGALIVIENELWPQRILAAHIAQVPVIVLGARMSDRSARRWANLPGVARNLLAPVRLVVPQDTHSSGHFAALGVDADALTPSLALKSAYVADDSALPDALRVFERQSTVLAASTHAGEEAAVLAAFTMARKNKPDLRLILAPRHPERATEVAALIKAQGVEMAQRSKGDAPNAAVYLADTLGEMPLWYRLAGVAFLGGSLVDRGGHTPFEPIAYGCPILHGPFVRNFADSYHTLDAEGGAVEVMDADTLADAMIAHLDDAGLAARARALFPPADVAAVVDRIKAILPAPPIG
ncbi:3-deoxy-D-manno-octulosonic acid transferase [Yoonia sp. R2331]|uniref:3-deoxy-D-manno-octulosonic acid transferase n=1 Tax=Yoonia sp. R2331 TaxID=3237238 RepID=UPI0034E4E5F4